MNRKEKSAEKFVSSLVDGWKVFEHVAPQELEEIGETLKAPFEHVRVLGVQRLDDGLEDDGKVVVKVHLEIARQLSGEA